VDALVLLTAMIAAASVALVSFGVWSIATAERTHVAWRVSRTGIGATTRAEPFVDVRVQGRSSAIFTPVDRALIRYDWADRISIDLRRAELNLYVSEYVIVRVLATVIPFVLSMIVSVTAGQPIFLFIGAVFASLIWWQIGAFVNRRVGRRQRAIDTRLDEALTNLAGSLSAGFSFLQACQMAVTQLDGPLKDEIEEMLEDVNVGASLDDALAGFAERIASYEVDIAVNAVLVQRQVGGSLAEILNSVANTIRERRELRGHLLALTAQQRLSAYFVASVPFVLGIFLSVTSWQFMSPLYNTLGGNLLLTAGIVLDLFGFVLMHRLTRIDF
jgi:tight adherence protein B